ncbi:MAG: MFS transporter [Negativicutes bacterium]|nr:MFS transporter [Negativicutes bacterium]
MQHAGARLFCVVTGLYWFSMYTYVPILPVYATSLGASHEMIGLIVGAYGLTQMLLRIPLGIASDMKNKRKPFIVAGALITGLSAVGMWLFPYVTALLMFRAMSGIAAAAWVVFPVLFTGYFAGQSAKAIGYLNFANFGGQFAGILAGSLAAQHWGREYTFVLAALGGAAGLLLSLFIEERAEVVRKPAKITELVAIAKNKNLLKASLLAVISQIISYSTVFAFTPVFAKQIGASSLELGILTLLSVLPTAFASAMSGTMFSRKLGEKATIILGFAVTAMACMYIPFADTIVSLYISQIIGGFGRGLAFSPLMALSLADVDQSRRATAMGFFQAVYAAGMFIGPVLAGLISSMAGLNHAFWTMGLCGICGAVATALAVKSVKVRGGQYA